MRAEDGSRGSRWPRSLSSEGRCELLAVEMNVWEQIRLFWGDLCLAQGEEGRRGKEEG